MQRRRRWSWLGLTVLLAGAVVALFAFLWSRDESKLEFLAQNVIAVERGDIILTLEFIGELRPARQAFLRFPISGIVAGIFIKEGESVQAGQVLASLEDAEQRLELLRAQQGDRPNLAPSVPLFPGLSLNASWEREMRVRLSTRALGIDWTVELRYGAQGLQFHLETGWVWAPVQPELELKRELALRRARRALDETVLRAPLAGVISELRLRTGDRVTEGEPVLTLMDRSSWWVEAPVAERDLARLMPDQRATVTFEAYPDLVLPAELTAVRFRAEQPKQLQAHLRLLQDDQRLLPGLTARASVVIQEAKGVLRVPLEAVVEIDGKSLVTRLWEGQYEEIEVRTGLSDDRWVEIRSGLAEGDLILANNYRLYERYRSRP